MVGRVRQVERAVEIFKTMREEGCQMNTVLYTTLIKGFARAGQVDQAVQIYEEMRKERSMQPDVITFSILIKANCDVGRLEEALKMLLAMKEAGLKPDEAWKACGNGAHSYNNGIPWRHKRWSCCTSNM